MAASVNSPPDPRCVPNRCPAPDGTRWLSPPSGGWCGVQAPLKFGAPGITLALGVGIGRVVFAALNRVEVVLAVVVLLAAG